MRTQFTIALRYLFGRKLRTVLTTLAITFGVLVLFGMNSVLPAMEEAFQIGTRGAFGKPDATVTLKTGDVFDQSVADQVASVEGVKAVSTSLIRSVNFPQDYFDSDPETVDRVTIITLTGIDVDAARGLHAYQVLDGRFLEATDPNAAVISQSLADAIGISVGDELKIPGVNGETSLTVVGILPARALPGSEEVLVTLATAQEITSSPGLINSVEAQFLTLDDAERSRIQDEILAKVGSNFEMGELASNSQFLTSLKLGSTLFSIMATLALLMGGFIIFNTFRTVVAERRRDIGMLRTLGATQRTILGIILAEGLIQGIIGTALGILAGYFFASLTLSALNPVFNQFMNIHVGGPVFGFEAFILSIFIGIGITLLAGILPAISASRVTPIEALRPSVGEVAFRRMAGWGFWIGVAMIVFAVLVLLTKDPGLISLGGVLFILGIFLTAAALVSPIAKIFSALVSRIYARGGTAQLAEGNLSRQPARAATTASTTLIALAIVVMAASLISSLLLGFRQILEKSLSSDFLVLPPSVVTWGNNLGGSEEFAGNLRSTEGVGVAASLRFAPAIAKDLNLEIMAIDPVDFPKVSGLEFSQGDETSIYANLDEGRNVVVNGILASTINVKLGDEIELLTPSGSHAYRIVGVATDYLDAKIPTAVISQNNLAADFGVHEDILFFINIASGADKDVVRTNLNTTLADYPQFRLIDGQAYIDENLALFDSMFAGIIALVLFLAIPSLIAMVNTLAIGVIERTREIGMLRAIGSTRSQIRTIILTEALILSGIGTVFGILSGLYLGNMAIIAMSSLGFPTQFVFPLTGILLGIAAGIFFGILAAVIPARQATKLQVVEALRYE
jgi:putative ABC transport system permease protein